MTGEFAPEIIGTGLAFPFRVGRHREIALVSGIRDIEQAIRIILATAPGERPTRPEFGCGIHRFVFEVIDAATIGHMDRAVREALYRWEPRIEVDEVTFDTSGADASVLLIDITYHVLHTTTPRNLVYPFYVIPTEGTGA
jgi:Bacteriophage baseplate protein W